MSHKDKALVGPLAEVVPLLPERNTLSKAETDQRLIAMRVRFWNMMLQLRRDKDRLAYHSFKTMYAATFKKDLLNCLIVR